MSSLDRLSGDICINSHRVSITRKLGEGGSAFVYLVRPQRDHASSTASSRGRSIGRRTTDALMRSISRGRHRSKSKGRSQSRPRQERGRDSNEYLVLKTASAASGHGRAQSENEVRMLRLLSGHHHILPLIDACFDVMNSGTSACLLLLEYCEGGSLMDVVMATLHENGNNSGNKKSSLSEFDILEFISQISEAVYYLHTFHDDTDTSTLGGDSIDPFNVQQGIKVRSSPYKASAIFRRVGQHYRNPIVHRDLKLENVLLKEDDRMPTGWRCLLCDFGSAIEGRVSLRDAEERRRAGDVIRSSTTQMYRAPEMVDLHLVPELTERTDLWALGCCLYTLCFLRNCFEENSNLAILSGSYSIPADHDFAPEMLELISRMICMDANQRASIGEILECLDAMKNGEHLPPRKLNKSSPPPQPRRIQSRPTEESLDTFDPFDSIQSINLNLYKKNAISSSPNEHDHRQFPDDQRFMENNIATSASTKTKKLKPTSAAAKRLHSTPQLSKLIAPNEIPTALATIEVAPDPEIHHTRSKAKKQQQYAINDPFRHQPQHRKNKSREIRRSSLKTKSFSYDSPSGSSNWAKFPQPESAVTDEKGTGKKNCIPGFAFDAFADKFDQNPLDQSGDFDQPCFLEADNFFAVPKKNSNTTTPSDFFKSDPCGFGSFRNSPSTSATNDNLSADPFFDRMNPDEATEKDVKNMMKKLKLGTQLNRFISNAKVALTSCNSGGQGQSLYE